MYLIKKHRYTQDQEGMLASVYALPARTKTVLGRSTSVTARSQLQTRHRALCLKDVRNSARLWWIS